MKTRTDLYLQNMLALDFVIRQGAARVRRRWYHESGANFDTIDCYRYDESGRLVETVESDEWFQCVYGYDEAGRIVRRIHSPVDVHDPNPPTIEQYVYDATGRIAHQTVFYQKPDTESTFSLDAQGRISAEHKQHLDTPDEATTDYHFYYDTAGRLQIVEESFSRGAWSVSTYHYDAQDRLILIYKRDSYGKTAITSS